MRDERAGWAASARGSASSIAAIVLAAFAISSGADAQGPGPVVPNEHAAPWGAGGALAQFETGMPIVEAGREEEVLGLFRPYVLAGEVAAGFRLMNVRIERSVIECELVGPDDERATLTLGHPEVTADPIAVSASFAATIDASSPIGRQAATALFDAVTENDTGGFYRRRANWTVGTTEHAIERFRGVRLVLDGLVLLALPFALFLLLLARQVRRAPKASALTIAAVTIVGVGLRLAMTQETMLGAWPFSRTPTIARLVFEGPVLAYLGDLAGARLYYFDVVTTMGFAFAILTPAAVYLHARLLLESERAALISAAIVALLPLHIRFSASEVAFIPSLVLSSFTFALVHVALKDPSRLYRRIALVALPFVAALMFTARPLNQIFLPLLLVTALFLARRTATLPRRVLVSTVVVVVGVLTFFMQTLPLYSGQIEEGLSVRTVIAGTFALLDPHHNTLINAWVTPLGLTLLAGAGAFFAIARRPEGNGREREVGFFLLSWLGLFFMAHAYVLPEATAMQARYHLHLVVPFTMLAALGLSHAYVRRRWVFVVAVLYVAVSPLLHHDFITDIAFDSQREYAFARAAAGQIPEDCTVLEYAGRGQDQDVRFDRAGTVLEDRVEGRLFTVVPLGGAVDASDPISPGARDVLEDPPECLYYYEGLWCYARKELDETLAETCTAMRQVHPLETVDSTSFEPRAYDANLAVELPVEAPNVELRLYRVQPRR